MCFSQETKTFVGKIESSSSTFDIPAMRKIVLVADNGEKLTVFVSRDIAIRDMKAYPTRIGKKAEVQYSPGQDGRNEAVSFRYVTSDSAAQSGNIFIGRIDKILPLDNMVRAVPDNNDQYMYFKLKDAVITDIDGKTVLFKNLEKEKRVEVKYSDLLGVGVSGAKTVKGVSMRYIPADYVPQTEAAGPAQPSTQPGAQATSAGDTFVGTVGSFPCGVGHFKSGPPLWPVGMIVVVGNNGKKNNFLILRSGTNATVFYDTEGKVIPIAGILSSYKNTKAVIGKKVEVKYAITPESSRYANKMLAISVRYVSTD